MTFTYRAADGAGWLAFVTDSRVLLVVPADAEFVDAAWSALASSTGFQSALDVLTGRGLAATPDFVLLEWEGGTARVIVRGAAALTVVADGGTHEVSGAGASTWVERTLEGVESVAFAAPGSAEGGIGLPVERGVVPVAHFGSTGAPAASSPIAAPEREPAPVAEPAPAPVPGPAPAPVEIDVEATVREAPEQVAVEDAPPAPASDGYHDLFGETLYRDVSAAVVRDAEPEEPQPVVDDELHDGETVMTTDIQKLRGRKVPREKAAPAVPAETSFVLVVSPGGARESLGQPLLVGRSPSLTKVSGVQMPRLLTIGTADQDISRNHAQFAVEGGTVVITDLHSRNGTTITLPGKPSQKLRAGEPTSIIEGTVVDFGGGLTMTVQEDR